MTALLSVRGLTLAHGSVVAVRGIDLDVAEGQVVCLIGANGAGKTTTLRGLSGLMKPRSGGVVFGGRDITGWPPHRIAKLGLIQVPEGRQIFSALSVAENVTMGGYLLGRADCLRRFDQVVSLFPRLAERLRQTAGLLSGGEQQMLALARALMTEPRLLLLDEPSMGLSPVMVDQIFSLIGRLKKDGKTILLIEQNARLALDMADFAYVLANGSIPMCGPAQHLARDEAVIAAYLGG